MLDRRRGAAAALVVLTVSIACLWSAIEVPFQWDDYHLILKVEGHPLEAARGPFAAYTWFSKTPFVYNSVQGDPFLSWFQRESNYLAFFRPLSSLFIWTNLRVFGRDPAAFTLVRLTIWAVALLLVHELYSRIAKSANKPFVVCLLASLLYAVHRCHARSIAYMSAVHTLLALLFSVLVLVAYIAHRTRGSRKHLVMALASFVLGALSSELVFGVLGWLVSYEWILSSDRPAKRVRAIVPFFAVALACFVFYKAFGFGCELDSADYIDPSGHPLAFASEVFGRRLPTLLIPAMGAVVRVESSATDIDWRGWGGLCLMIGCVLPHLRRDKTARFMALGCILSVLPGAAGAPSDRLLLLPTVGTCFIVASFAVDAWHRRFRPTLVGAAIVVGVQLVAPPFLLHRDLNANRRQVEAQIQRALDAEMPPETASRDARVVFLTSFEQEPNGMLPWIRVIHGRSWPRAVWSELSLQPGRHRIVRTGASSFVFEAPPPGFLATDYERGLRMDLPFLEEGASFHQGAFHATIARKVAGQIRALEVTIDRSLDAPDVWLLRWDGRHYARIAAPPVGAAIVFDEDGVTAEELSQARADRSPPSPAR